MNARRITFTRDGMLIALCDDGAVWLYSPAERRWSYLLTGGLALAHLALNETESTAFVFDVDGRLLSILKPLANNSNLEGEVAAPFCVP